MKLVVLGSMVLSLPQPRMTVVDRQADVVALAEIEVAVVDHDRRARGSVPPLVVVDHQATHYVLPSSPPSSGQTEKQERIQEDKRFIICNATSVHNMNIHVAAHWPTECILSVGVVGPAPPSC